MIPSRCNNIFQLIPILYSIEEESDDYRFREFIIRALYLMKNSLAIGVDDVFLYNMLPRLALLSKGFFLPTEGFYVFLTIGIVNIVKVATS